MTIRDLLSSSGSAADIGDIKQSAAGDAVMASKGFLPARGGILTQAAYPALYAGIKHRGYAATFSDTPLMTSTNGNISGPLSDFDGDDLIMYASTSSSYYWQLLRASTGVALAGTYLTSYIPTVVRFSGTAFYIGDNDGALFRFAGPAYTSSVSIPKSVFAAATYRNIFDVLEHNGYVYVANGEGIYRALLTSNLSQAASWAKVFNYSYAYVYNTPGATQQCNFTVDPVTGYLFFQTASSGGVVSRSTNGGDSWTNISTPSSVERSKIVRWGASLYMFMRNTPQLTSVTTADQTRVLKSTDNGASWAHSTMQLHCTAKHMQPFVKNGYLFYAYNDAGNDIKIRMLVEERSGLQTPTTPEWHSNVLEIATFSPNPYQHAAFKSNDAFGARLITHVVNNPANSTPASRLIVPNFDLATQFRLPVIDSQIPTYLKAA
jgi:hypothetical protein